MMQGLKRNREDSLFHKPYEHRIGQVVLTLAEEDYLQRTRLDQLSASRDVVSSIVDYYKKIVTRYYRDYYDVDILWKKSFKDIAQFIRSRI